MSDRARELLESVVEYWGIQAYPHDWEKLVRGIRAYLAEPEVKREALSSLEIVKAYRENMWEGPFNHFKAGIRFAEKHHGIGGGDESIS